MLIYERNSKLKRVEEKIINPLTISWPLTVAL